MLRQFKNGVPVRIGKTLLRRFTIRQPGRVEMLFRRKDDRIFFRDKQTENMFRIFRHTRSETVAPDRKYFKNIFCFPVFKTGNGNFMLFRSCHLVDHPDSGFLENLAYGRPDKRFRQGIARSGYRLPETRPIGTLDQQDIQFFRINDDKNRLWNFVGHIQNETREPAGSLSFLMLVESFLFFSNGYAVPAAVSR